jgi:putative ABC transport system ATP-binding protein
MTAPFDSILRTEKLTLHFDAGQIRALNGVNLEVQEGEFVAITGPSGCGKSSLLNLIGTLDLPSSGEIYFRGQPYSKITDLSLFRRQNIGFIFQAFQLLPTLSALDNVLVPTIGCSGTASEHQKHAMSLLEQLGLGHRMHHFPGKLSGGERQRVAIARSLINNPAIILADEPTGSLDSSNAAQALDLIEQLRQERALTIIMVTHDMNVSARADRLIPMCDGKVKQKENP